MGRRSCLGCVGILVAMLICGGLTFAVVDGLCYAGLSQRMPIYPGATVTRQTHNLVRAYGMGNTVLVLYSPDDPDTVRAWYARETGTLLRNLLQSGNPRDGVIRTLTQSQFDITRDESGAGSQILLFGTCAN